MERKYTFHQDFYIRTPALSLNFYYDLVDCKTIEDQKFEQLWNDEFIKEAIYIASPNLYEAIEEWMAGNIHNERRIDGIRIKYLSYLIRMSTRSTPFGLFAGISMGTFSHQNSLIKKALKEQHRKTRFDMHFLCNVWSHLANHPEIKPKSNFILNNTLYELGDHYRYIKFSNNKEHREYTIGGVNKTKILSEILERSKSFTAYKDLIQHIINHGFSSEEAILYIDSLIESQILVSEYTAQVTGEDNFNSICQIIKTFEPSIKLLDFAKSGTGLLKKLDRDNHKHCLQDYKDLEKCLKSIDIPYKIKHVTQTDSYHDFEHASLNKKYAYQLLRGIQQLSSLHDPQSPSSLTEFKKKFRHRYDRRTVPLNQVLDVEMGIGYGMSKGWYTPKFVQQISEQSNGNSDNNTGVHQNLKYLIKPNSKSHISEVDISELIDKSKINHSQNFGTSFYAMLELLECEGKTMMYLKAMGTPAATLLSRFSHLNTAMRDSIQQLIDNDAMDEGKIVAEIIHLPQSRTGNILFRATTRDYEIPYCSKSSKSGAYQIPINDLMVYLSNDKVKLHSKKFNKEVVPMITSAHNYKNNPLPIYEFLCDLSKQHIRLPNFDTLIDTKNLFFSPRITLRNIIIKKAQWNLNAKHVEELNSILEKSSQMHDIKNWRELYGVPQFIISGDKDNLMPINLNNQNCLFLLKQLVKHKNPITLFEFIEPAQIVANQNGLNYTNEIIFVYKQEAQF